jgi:hypothetical protein
MGAVGRAPSRQDRRWSGVRSAPAGPGRTRRAQPRRPHATNSSPEAAVARQRSRLPARTAADTRNARCAGSGAGTVPPERRSLCHSAPGLRAACGSCLSAGRAAARTIAHPGRRSGPCAGRPTRYSRDRGRRVDSLSRSQIWLGGQENVGSQGIMVPQVRKEDHDARTYTCPVDQLDRPADLA